MALFYTIQKQNFTLLLYSKFKYLHAIADTGYIIQLDYTVDPQKSSCLSSKEYQ